MRENAREKSRRLLICGAVSISRCDRSGVVAMVKGDSGMRLVTYRAGVWSCDCPAVGMCSHGLAVAAVTAPPGAWLEGVA
jgi:uncharacterized Zn finger protein